VEALRVQALQQILAAMRDIVDIVRRADLKIHPRQEIKMATHSLRGISKIKVQLTDMVIGKAIVRAKDTVTGRTSDLVNAMVIVKKSSMGIATVTAAVSAIVSIALKRTGAGEVSATGTILEIVTGSAILNAVVKVNSTVIDLMADI